MGGLSKVGVGAGREKGGRSEGPPEEGRKGEDEWGKVKEKRNFKENMKGGIWKSSKMKESLVPIQKY